MSVRFQLGLPQRVLSQSPVVPNVGAAALAAAHQITTRSFQSTFQEQQLAFKVLKLENPGQHVF
jgi:hypothetical protein